MTSGNFFIIPLFSGVIFFPKVRYSRLTTQQTEPEIYVQPDKKLGLKRDNALKTPLSLLFPAESDSLKPNYLSGAKYSIRN